MKISEANGANGFGMKSASEKLDSTEATWFPGYHADKLYSTQSTWFPFDEAEKVRSTQSTWFPG
jgi:hypothetical protein